MTEDPRFSVVVPVYKNASSLRALVEVLEGLSTRRGSLEAVFVVDGCPDESEAVLRSLLPRSHLRAQLVALSRNFGSFPAIQRGLACARGQFVCVMAADLQEPVSFVEDAFRALESGQAEVVVGQRVAREDPVRTQLAARAYWRAYRSAVNSEVPPGGVDVFGCSRRVANEIAAMHESHTSLVGLLYWVGYRRLAIPYQRAARHSGKSTWGVRRRIRYLLDSVYAFTDLPIVLVQVVGVLGVALSFLTGIAVFCAWLAGWVTEPGYVPLMVVITGGTSSILLALGIVGSYTWRAYENTKSRPTTIVASEEVFD